MDKKIAGLLGAVAALTTMSAAQAAIPQPPELTPPSSYADLLTPVSNATDVLKADNSRLAQVNGEVQMAQYHHHHHYRHHHHHYVPPIIRHFIRRPHHHHHYHHHHHH